MLETKMSDKRPIRELISERNLRNFFLQSDELSGHAGVWVDVVESELIPQTEAVVVDGSAVALHDRAPLGVRFVQHGIRIAEVEEAGVESLLEGSWVGSSQWSNPHVNVTHGVVESTHVNRPGSVNVDGVVDTAGVVAGKQLRIPFG